MSEGVPLLVLTRSEQVRSAVCRLAAAIGVPARIAGEQAAADVATEWRSARTVVVDAALCDGPRLAALPRRGDVYVVAVGDPGEAAWRWALRTGACDVLRLPADESRLVEHLAAGGRALTARVLAVLGGCGGAGASTFAAALALTSAPSRRTVLVDADATGGGLDVLLGAESAAGARWPDLAAARGSLPAAGLLATLVAVGGLPVLSWGRSPAAAVPDEAIGAVLEAVTRGCDLAVADLPRHLEPGFESLLALADQTAVIVPATVRGVAAAAVTLARLPTGGRRCVVVRDPGGPALSADDVGGHLGLPVAAVVVSEAAVRDAALRGDPPVRRDRGSLHDACRTLLRGLEARPVAA